MSQFYPKAIADLLKQNAMTFLMIQQLAVTSLLLYHPCRCHLQLLWWILPEKAVFSPPKYFFFFSQSSSCFVFFVSVPSSIYEKVSLIVFCAGTPACDITVLLVHSPHWKCKVKLNVLHCGMHRFGIICVIIIQYQSNFQYYVPNTALICQIPCETAVNLFSLS